jgi:hypothetical protein
MSIKAVPQIRASITSWTSVRATFLNAFFIFYAPCVERNNPRSSFLSRKTPAANPKIPISHIAQPNRNMATFSARIAKLHTINPSNRQTSTMTCKAGSMKVRRIPPLPGIPRAERNFETWVGMIRYSMQNHETQPYEHVDESIDPPESLQQSDINNDDSDKE